MRQKCSLILLALCLLLTACGPAVQPEQEPEPPLEASAPEEMPAPAEEPQMPDLPQREREWVEDIEFLREKIRTEHPDPFRFCTEEEFDLKMDQLSAGVGELSDSDIFYELEAIITGTMGDTHTRLWWDGPLPLCDRIFAVNFFPQNGKLYLLNYLEGCDQFEPYLLHEIVGVNGVHSLYLMQRAAELYAPFNWHSTTEFPEYPSFFDWVGCDYKEGYTFQILNGNQEVESIEVPVITSAEANGGTWVYPEGWGRIFFGKSEDWAEYVEGGDGGCVYLHYSILYSTPSIVKSFDTASTLIKEHPECKKLVIDMRDHPGGSAARLPQVRNSAGQFVSPAIEQVYVVTGGYTASAAVISLGIFQSLFDNMVVIGEPTGQFDPFLCVMNNEFVSPHLQYSVRISNMWYDAETDVEKYYDEDGKLYPWESCILPDVYIHQDIEDVRQGKDSVIEWVLAQ